MNTIIEKCRKKHPEAFDITTNSGEYYFVDTPTQEIMYAVDKLGRLRLCNKRERTPTERAVMAEPIDHVIMVTGEGPYKGQYYNGTAGFDGWLNLVSNIDEAHKMRASTAEEVRGYIAFHAQHCYGGKFQKVKVNL